jgi:hypothetical protein
MPSFDSLYGITNFSDLDLSQILTGSLITHYDWGFLNVGAFVNVKLNATNINGGDMSLLRRARDPAYTDGRVWEMAHDNVVYESGLLTGTPISISGIYINGTLQSLTSGTYKGVVEYKNGRVIFDSGIVSTATVKMEYSYKTVLVVEAKNSPILKGIQFRTFDPSNNNFSQFSSGEYNTNPSVRMALPLCGVEVTPRLSMIPHELGNKVQRIDINVLFHALGEDDNQVKRIITTIARQKESSFFLLDMNLMSKSGAYPLDMNGRLTQNSRLYPDLVKDNAYRGELVKMTNADASNGKWISTNLYHGTVNTTIEIIY